MSIPEEKALVIDEALKEIFGVDRRTAISQDICVSKPIGCGLPAPFESFRDEVAAREYAIPGLCQACQDKFFGKGSDAS